MKATWILGFGSLLALAYFIRSSKGKKMVNDSVERFSRSLSRNKHADKIAKADLNTEINIGNNSSFSVFGN